MSNIEKRLAELGITIPEVPTPIAAYVPGVQCGDLLFTSGQVPKKDGALVVGKLGADATVEQGYESARLCAINIIAVVKSMVGDLDRVERVVKVVGFVNGTADFADQPQVINGASELLLEVFGDAGKHARSAVGMGSLPGGVMTEVEAVFKIKP